MSEQDNHSLVEQILSNNRLSKSWDSLTKISQIQTNLIQKIKDLSGTKQILETNKTSSIKAKNELIALNKELDADRRALQDNVNEKNAILAETKQSEAEYLRVLKQKQTLKDSFEREMASLELELKIKVDSARLPHSGSQILSWPLSSVKITQYFGNTPFATANPQVYNGAGHTGIDLKAFIGTPVMAALDGTVVGVANTDIVRTCYSYGKWIMIKHDNGLSTLYAHLSSQIINIGDRVKTGDIIGYSGNTGYSTGPHLHFGVYASDGVQITKLTSSKNCRGVTLPLADKKAYLNPLSYL
jgi:murein DD-endopeptidase MepM/ murein hydrolase activator NlpD